MSTTSGFIREYLDPISALLVASTAVSAGGQLFSAVTASGEARQAALFEEQRADQEAVRRDQELRDFDRQARTEEARANAIFAAIGADLSSGNPLAIAQSRAAETAVGRLRIEQQSFLREQGFRQRASGQRRRATTTLVGGTLAAASTAARGGQSFLRINRTRAATGAA